MPITVDIPGQNTAVDFPDEMSQEDIKAVLRRKFSNTPPLPPAPPATAEMYAGAGFAPPADLMGKETIGPDTRSEWQKFRESDTGHKLFGSTDIERANRPEPEIGVTEPFIKNPAVAFGPGGLAGKALMGLFTADFARQLPEQFKAAKQAYEKEDWPTLRKIAIENGLGAAMIGLGLKGAIGEHGVTEQPDATAQPAPAQEPPSQPEPPASEPSQSSARSLSPEYVKGLDDSELSKRLAVIGEFVKKKQEDNEGVPPEARINVSRLYDEALGRGLTGKVDFLERYLGRTKELPETTTDELQSAWSKFEDGNDTASDLLDTVEGLVEDGRAPESLRGPIEDYREAMREDFEKYAGRGDVETHENKFVEAVRKALSPTEQTAPKPPSPSTAIPRGLIDLSGINNASTIPELNAIGGKLVIAAKTGDEIALVQDAMKRRSNELQSRGPGTGEGPGSPSLSQGPDPKAQIQQLEETFQMIDGKKVPLTQKVKEAFDWGGKVSAAKDAIGKAVSGLKTSGDFLLKKWNGIPDLDDMLKAKGELSSELEKRGWRLRQFENTVLKQMPDKAERAAIAKWVDAGGDMAELQRGEAETRPEYKKAYQDAQKLKGDQLVAAQNIRSYFEARLDEAINAGVLEDGVEDYLHRIYEKDPKAAKQAMAYVQSGILSDNPALAKKRVFQWDWEAEKHGLNPVQDFLPRITQYEASLSRAIAAREFIKKTVGDGKNLKGMKAPDGRPVIDVAGLGVPLENQQGVREATLIKPQWKPGDDANPKNNRRDYKERDYPALRKWKWTTTDANGKPIFVQGDLIIHPDYVGRVDALLKPSAIRYAEKPVARAIGRGALALSSTVKQTMLDLSGFHQTQITIHGMEHKVNPLNLVQDIDFENPDVEGLLRGGLTIGGDFHSKQTAEGLVGSSLTRHIPILGPLTEGYHDWLFTSLIPRMKTTMALKALERNRARYKGKMSEEQIFQKTASEANSAFGGLNYIMLERSKTAQDISRLIMLAPDFLEARGRFAGGALERGGKSKVPGGGNEQRAALLLGALTMYTTARILNKLTDDQYHFEPENAFSWVHNGRAYSLRTVQGDILHLLEHPAQFWLHRLNPVYTRPMLEAATGRDYFGRKRNAMEQAWDAVSTAIPIALRSSREQSLIESMSNAFGVTSRRWNDVDDAFKLAQKWKDDHHVGARGEFIYDPAKDPLRGLKIALSQGDTAASANEIKKLVDSKATTRAKLRDYFDRYADMPFTGSRANDAKFTAGLTDDQKKTVAAAKLHKKQLRALYIKAAGMLDANPPAPSANQPKAP